MLPACSGQAKGLAPARASNLPGGFWLPHRFAAVPPKNLQAGSERLHLLPRSLAPA